MVVAIVAGVIGFFVGGTFGYLTAALMIAIKMNS